MDEDRRCIFQCPYCGLPHKFDKEITDKNVREYREFQQNCPACNAVFVIWEEEYQSAEILKKDIEELKEMQNDIHFDNMEKAIGKIIGILETIRPKGIFASYVSKLKHLYVFDDQINDQSFQIIIEIIKQLCNLIITPAQKGKRAIIILPLNLKNLNFQKKKHK